MHAYSNLKTMMAINLDFEFTAYDSIFSGMFQTPEVPDSEAGAHQFFLLFAGNLWFYTIVAGSPFQCIFQSFNRNAVFLLNKMYFTLASAPIDLFKSLPFFLIGQTLKKPINFCALT